MLKERRECERRKVRQYALVATEEELIVCMVVDRSDGGFRLHVDAAFSVPKRFKLQLLGRNEEYSCERVWTDGNLVGVRRLEG